MLRSFRLGNHRSFRDEQEFLLLPAHRSDRQALTVAAVFGANAAGKSNLLDGLSFMAGAVLGSYRRWDPEAGVPRHPYRPTGDASPPSVFVVDLLRHGIRYVYGFEVNDEAVLTEWLYAYPHHRKRVLFERDGETVTYGGTLTGLRDAAPVIAKLTRPNALLLSLSAQLDVSDFLPVYQWFSRYLPRAGRQSHTALVDYLDLGGDRDRVLDLVRAADVGISNLRIDDREPPSDNSMIIMDFRAHERPSGAFRSRTWPRLASGRLRFAHGAEGELFDLSEESDGTRAWLAMLPLAISALDTGATLVIDELDASLHPQLSAQLVRLFQSEKTNPANAQLIFTTHDASLLGTSFGATLLDRDQIWFVEKDPDGASRLYPLSDFHPRSGGENRERRYLAGSYGAVPVLSDTEFVAAARRGRPEAEAS
jgi:hypothetical protein